MPYQDRQTLEEEGKPDDLDDAPPPRRSPQFVLVVILVAVLAAGIATAFALLHSP